MRKWAFWITESSGIFLWKQQASSAFSPLSKRLVHLGGLKLLVAKWKAKQGEVSRVQGGPPWPASVATYAGIIGEPSGNSLAEAKKIFG